MTSDLDTYQTANELIKERGLKGASDYAADRIRMNPRMRMRDPLANFAFGLRSWTTLGLDNNINQDYKYAHH